MWADGGEDHGEGWQIACGKLYNLPVAHAEDDKMGPEGEPGGVRTEAEQLFHSLWVLENEGAVGGQGDSDGGQGF